MSKLQQALLSPTSVPNIKPLGSTGQQRVRASEVYADARYEKKSRLLDAIDKFAKWGADAYNQNEQRKQDLADERSNEIIRKLTPEQRREALQNGTLLYQDDPYVMQALSFKTGRNAAYLIDDEVAQKVKNGEFRTREELEKYRHERLQKASSEYAEMFGISEGDSYYQKGFNADITERNISLYGQHDNFLSDQAKKGLLINGRVELNSVLNDPELLRSDYAGQFFESYFNKGLNDSSIPSDDQAYSMISQSLSDVVNKEGGSQFLQQIENRKITLHGKEATFRDLLGNEQWNNLMIKAQHNEMQLNARKAEDFKLNINSSLNNPDLNAGWEQLQVLKARLNTYQTGNELTPERELIIQAEMQMQNKLNKQAMDEAKAMDDLHKTINKNAVIDSQFQKRINGQYVSTNYKDLPTNDNTGQFSYSDMVNYANSKLEEIDKMNIPDEQKDKMKLSYLKADSSNGAFRTAVGELIRDANGEWQSAVVNGQLPEDGGVALNQLRRLRNVDPSLFASLYPDDAELFVTMDMMDKQGINPQIMIDSERSMKNISREMRQEDDLAWRALKNDSSAPELARLPVALDNVARKIYDGVKYRTGNADLAMAEVTKYLKDNTVSFKASYKDSSTYGVITKNALMLTDDPNSWEVGRDMLMETIDNVKKSNGWLDDNQILLLEDGDDIRLSDTTGQVQVTFNKERVKQEYLKAQEVEQERLLKEQQEELRKEQERQAKKRNDEINRANKRTLHAKAMINREERRKKEREENAKIMRKFYGFDD